MPTTRSRHRRAAAVSLSAALLLSNCGSERSADERPAATAASCPSSFTSDFSWEPEGWEAVDFAPEADTQVCEYWTDWEPHPVWERAGAPVALDADGVALIARLLDGLTPYESTGGCPMNNGPTLLIAQGDDDQGFRASVQDHGCGYTTISGSTTTWTPGSDDRDALVRLLHPVDAATEPLPGPDTP